MASATSSVSGLPDDIRRICRSWGAPRSRSPAALAPRPDAKPDITSPAIPPARPRPKPTLTDEAPLAADRRDLDRCR